MMRAARLHAMRILCACGMVAAWLGSPPAAQAGEAQADGFFARVVDQARALAAKPYASGNFELPKVLADIDYDAYRDIRFRPAKALWHGESLFEVQFFHPGFLYGEPVKINVVENGTVRPVHFSRDLFDYGKTGLENQPLPDLGFAGFRLHYPLNRPDYKDEVAVFLGASYFRLLGRGQAYGISARGLAIDTAMPQGEEFPSFREFWLVRPAPEATSITVYALLDSRSVAGAYRFDIHPDTETVMEVEAVLFARTDVQRLGIAPLTSMFFFGENHTRNFDDYRPEVHDSDGLLAHNGAGEWIWRPLSNPRELRVTMLLDQNPRGFGLVQRDREFEHYLDTESYYERRPSYWVEPLGDSWGRGAVYLVEIPSDEEIDDNIVAFWVSDQPLKAGASRTVAYRLHASLGPPPAAGRLGRVERTRIGWGAVPGTAKKPPRSLRRVIVDFTGDELRELSALQPVRADLQAKGGKVSDLTVHKIGDRRGWRVSFRLAPDGGQPVDMRLALMLREKRLTETWSYVWSLNELDLP